VGELSAHLETQVVWKEPMREGVIYYLNEGLIAGVLLWNVWGQVDRARELIRAQAPLTDEERRGAIPLNPA
jgi:hypothetical protein